MVFPFLTSAASLASAVVLVAVDPATPAPADRGAFYALVGVIGAAFITTVGAVIIAIVTRRNKEPGAATGLDANTPERRRTDDGMAEEIRFLTQTYQDARKDLEGCREEIDILRAQVQDRDIEVAEARMLTEYFMRELELRREKDDVGDVDTS